ncbi:MAG: hypothetical protein H6735_19215 [Alphaproteobacteria bacterium]|nr:hypothetical protein [Alphaproteobacteria bacterium]
MHRSMGRVVVGVVLGGWSTSAAAFTSGEEGHERITETALAHLQPRLVDEATYWNNEQDSGSPQDDYQRHFDGCRLVEGIAYINQQIGLSSAALDPARPDPFQSAKQLGRMLHGVQDFYSHANWVELLRETEGPDGTWSSENLFDRSPTTWRTYGSLDVVRDDIRLGERPLDTTSTAVYKPVMPLWPGWTATQSLTSAIPIVTTPGWGTSRALITHWKDDGACLDVRPPTVELLTTGVHVTDHRLRHGDSDSSSETWAELNKDGSDRPGWPDSFRMATWQSQQAWCQVLGTAQQTYGHAAVGTAYSLMQKEGSSGHSTATTCGTPRRTGPVEVVVTVDRMAQPMDPSTTSRAWGLSLFTTDLDQSTVDRFTVSAANYTVDIVPDATVSLCVEPSESVGLTLAGYDDHGPAGLDAGDHAFGGPTLVFTADGSARDLDVSTADHLVSMDVQIRYDQTDLDGDGWSRCEEAAYGSSDTNPDFDHDGIPDGWEDKWGTDPFDPDTDDDGVPDGAEVDCGTDPLSPWTSGNPLDDFTMCPPDLSVDPGPTDSDSDRLSDAAEELWGLDPKNPDSDGDTWVDGLDPSWLADLFAVAPAEDLSVPKDRSEEEHRNVLEQLALDADLAMRSQDPSGAVERLDQAASGLADCPADKGAPSDTCAAVLALATNIASGK